MKVMIDIPKEFETDLQDKFNEFFERMIADIDYALEKQEPLLCGNYERETAEMFLSAFENATIIPDNATDGDVIKAMFPKLESREKAFEIELNVNKNKIGNVSVEMWNAPYKREVEE